MPLASTASPTCAPREVAKYSGARILDLGSHLEIVFDHEPPRGTKASLLAVGWQKQPSGAYRRISMPSTIMEAQLVLSEFCGECR